MAGKDFAQSSQHLLNQGPPSAAPASVKRKCVEVIPATVGEQAWAVLKTRSGEKSKPRIGYWMAEAFPCPAVVADLLATLAHYLDEANAVNHPS